LIRTQNEELEMSINEKVKEMLALPALSASVTEGFKRVLSMLVLN